MISAILPFLLVFLANSSSLVAISKKWSWNKNTLARVDKRFWLQVWGNLQNHVIIRLKKICEKKRMNKKKYVR